MADNRVIFFGTPKIAVSCLKALIDVKVNVVAVVTKPDMPIGRKQIMQESEVKLFAKQNNIQILQPNKINDVYEDLIALKPDLFIVCAFGKLISERVLQIPQYHAVNIHTSLLPR
jgi:methionyl-tRNA formyltransferase